MRYANFPFFLALGACGPLADLAPAPKAPEPFEGAGPPPPPKNARTIEQFDTTTEAERVAAASSSGGQKLGQTVASLGDAAMPGFWVETSLVEAVSLGRVVNTGNGKSVDVELRPVAGSSRVSLAALRVLEAPLTDLVTIEVYRR